MLQQFTGGVIKLEKQCQVSCLKGQKLPPTLKCANIWAFVGFNRLRVGKQPLKHRVLVAILDRGLPAPPQQAETCCGTDFSAAEVSHSGFWGEKAQPRQRHCLPRHLHPPTAGHAAPLPSPAPAAPGGDQLPLGTVLSPGEKNTFFSVFSLLLSRISPWI